MNIKQLIVATALACVNLLSINAQAESSVWKVSKGANYFYLGGTVHLLNAGDYPLPEEFSEAYRDASEIIFETDITATQTPQFQAKLLTAMTYGDDRTLITELQPEIYRQLQDFMSARQLPVANFTRFQPWGVSLMLTMLEYQRLGMMPNYGVDAYFNIRALADGKQIGSLETPDEQLGFLTSMADIDPNEGIESTLSDLARLPEFIQRMKQDWRSGDLEAFAENAFVLEMEKAFPEVYYTLVTGRNNAWMTKLPALIDNTSKEFVLLGAMHLVGEDGLLSQLKARGFKVEQL